MLIIRSYQLYIECQSRSAKRKATYTSPQDTDPSPNSIGPWHNCNTTHHVTEQDSSNTKGNQWHIASEIDGFLESWGTNNAANNACVPAEQCKSGGVRHDGVRRQVTKVGDEKKTRRTHAIAEPIWTSLWRLRPRVG
jgi:hypothetical protein